MPRLPVRVVSVALLHGILVTALQGAETALRATAEKPASGKVLGKIAIRGLTRTREGVILQYVTVRAGDDLSTFDADALRVYLERLRIFSQVAIRLTEADEESPCRSNWTRRARPRCALCFAP